MPEAPRIAAVQLDADGKVTQTARSRVSDVSIETTPSGGARLMRGGKPLTEEFKAIDTFDVSESRAEVAFSAKRETDFDIGLVALEGSALSWVPHEKTDEVGVQWAPRGNKISYVVRATGGDLVRVVHIPTSFQLGSDFPFARIHALGWDPPAEQFAVAYSTPDASDRVEVMNYQGHHRRIVIEPSSRLDVEVESFGPEAIVVRPRDITYGEKLPLVIWIDEEPYAWSDARAELMRNARAALVITKQAPGDSLWRMAQDTPWIDVDRRYVVAPRRIAIEKGTLITSDPAMAAGRVRREDRVVAVAPAVVQSFAARFIADQLKRITPPNGSSR